MTPRKEFGLLALASFLHLTGVILHIVGMATPNWMTHVTDDQSPDTVTTEGLFTYCTRTGCQSIPVITWLSYAVIIAAISGCVATILGIIFICLLMRREKLESVRLGTSSGIMGIISGIAIAVACVFYRVLVYDGFSKIVAGKFALELGYSFYLSVSGLCVITVGSILMFVGIHKLQIYFRSRTPSVPPSGLVNTSYFG